MNPLDWSLGQQLLSLVMVAIAMVSIYGSFAWSLDGADSQERVGDR